MMRTKGWKTMWQRIVFIAHSGQMPPGMKNKPMRLALLALAVIASVVVFFIPGGICPLCAMKTMRCHIVFQPFVRIMSVLVAGSGVGALVASWKKDAKPSA